MHPVLLMLLLSSKPIQWKVVNLQNCCYSDFTGHNTHFGVAYIGKRLSFLVLGPSLAGSSDILMASSIAAKRPLPPSPLRAGPKHSGLRMRRRTTTLAFSSTLSPTAKKRMSFIKGQINGMQQNDVLHQNKDQTIDKYSKSKKVKIFLSTAGIPSNIRVTFGQ